MPKKYYVTPYEDLPRIDGHPTGYYYAEDERGDQVIGVDFDAIVRAAVERFKSTKIVDIVRVG